MSDGSEQAPFVEPIDPAEGGDFQILHVAPWTLAVDQLRFVEAVYGLSEGVVIGVTDTADRWLNACFGQTLGVSYGQILPAAVRVMDQAPLLHRPPIMQGLLEGIDNKVCLGRP